eukprot:SAG22_NODE_1963_length_3241_cov_3.416932_7_plen_65_part_00
MSVAAAGSAASCGSDAVAAARNAEEPFARRSAYEHVLCRAQSTSMTVVVVVAARRGGFQTRVRE